MLPKSQIELKTNILKVPKKLKQKLKGYIYKVAQKSKHARN